MKFALIFAGLSGLLGVALGAGAAHALKRVLDERALALVETAVRYQLVHAAALVGLAALIMRPWPALQWVAWAWAAGTVLFCGSLYLLAFTGVRAFAHVAPFGGLALILGWGLLAVLALRLGG
jgi:uncharacterized membrane protein YgdD (TMEM256/DUF423 family)